MPPRPSLLLLDANIVIELHSLGTWELLVGKVEILLPSIVADQEARWYIDRQSGQRRPIDLGKSIDDGAVRRLEAKASEMQDLLAQFDAVFASGIDPGEQEALALLLAGRCPDSRFSTADAPAIQALALIGCSEQGMSLEDILKSVGLGRPLKPQYSRAFFERHLQGGQRMRIQGIGLAHDSRLRLDFG